MAAGDCHGHLATLYDAVAELEAQAGCKADLVVQVGDLGVWPDPTRMKEVSVRHGEGAEFAKWRAEQRAVPRPTIFIAGNHEDFDFLTASPEPATELLPGLTFLSWGQATRFDCGGQTLWIGGVGGCFSPSDYWKNNLPGRRRRHYLWRDIERLCTRSGPALDILLLHDAPMGVVREGVNGLRRIESRSEGMDELIAHVRPRICFTGHYHVRSERIIEGVPTTSLAILPRPGSLVLLDFAPGTELPKVVAEFRELKLEPAPPPPPSAEDLRAEQLLIELEDFLRTWTNRVKAELGAAREFRQQLHHQMKENSELRLFLAALKGSSLWEMFDGIIPKDRRAETLERWRQGNVPKH